MGLLNTLQAFFDTILLITSLAYSCVWASKKAFMIAYPYILWPMRCFAITSSTFMTVVIATERFMAVRHPLRYKNNTRCSISSRTEVWFT